jgi:thiamine pyrophosphokinase|tara:strand:+ start:401 stop:1027 length:627 start_codon:yes stop_codon:yes gene_type:complete
MLGILWCNGDVPSKNLIQHVISIGDRVFGIDGGADKAYSAEIIVERVLGDLDSVDISKWKNKTEYLSNQEMSDFAKSVIHLMEKGFTEIEVIGIDGGSPEHILGIWGALAELPGDVRIKLHHESRTTYRIHPDDEDTEIFIKKGEEFSIFALTPCKEVFLKGSKWEIEGEKLSLSTRGLHNIGIGRNISIKADGVIALIIQKGHISLL